MKARELSRGMASVFGLFAALASTSAVAQNAAGEEAGVGIADIVVTAQRREQSLQSVPISISALSQQTLTDANVTTVAALPLLSPGIQIQPQFVPGNATFQIRGQQNSDTGPTIDSSVGVYFDDVYIARSTGSLVNMVDLARVEILKGAQGTLFGKNNAGGVIKLVSNKPTQDFEGYAKAGFESYDRLLLEGVINLPLNDIAALRVVGQFDKKWDGYGTNTLNGRAIDRQRTYFTRGSLKIDPTDNLSILVQGDYSNTKGGGLVNYFSHYYPTSAGGATTALEVALDNGLWDLNPANQAAAIAAGGEILKSYVRNGTRRVANDVRTSTADAFSFNTATRTYDFTGGYRDPRNWSKAWGGSLHIDWDLGGAQLTSITAYRKIDYYADYNLDGIEEHILDTLQAMDQHQFSQEVLLNGTSLGDRLDWTVGGIYFNEDAFQTDRSVTYAGVLALRGTAGTFAFQHGLNKSYGLFGQATYKLTDALSVTGGLRWSKDDRTFIANSFNVAAGTGVRSCVFTVANGLATLPIYSDPCTLTQKASKAQWSYTAAVDYQIDPGKLVYFRTSRGYRAGGFNPRILAPESLGSFRPEVVTDYEVGLKADWLDGTLRTNFALFHSKGKDIQNTRSAISATTGASLTFIENRGTRKVDGFEMEILARPAPWFNFNTGLSYLDAKLDDPLNPTIDWVINVPKWAWNTGATVEHDFGNVTAKLRGDMSYRGKMFETYTPPTTTAGVLITNPMMSDVVLLSARFSLRHEASGIEFALYGRNLTNELYAAKQATQNGLGITFTTLAEPRVLGLEVKVPFGAAAR